MDKTQVSLWEPHDFNFEAEVKKDNLFKVDFNATVKGPEGEKINLPGFYNGDNIWTIRFSPTKMGTWEFVTESSIPELNNKKEKIKVLENNNENVHGGLKVDPNNKHHFIFEDNQRFFLMGYECDWLWAMDREDQETLVDKIKDKGFNYIILNIFAYDTGWRKGKTGDDDYGPPELFPWEGTNENPDHSKFNIKFWKKYDETIEMLYQKGMIAHIFFKVYNKQVNWPEAGSVEDNLYFKHVISRYCSYPNVVWDFSKEAFNERDNDYKRGRFEFIKNHDPYNRLLTCHDEHNDNFGRFNDILDFRTDQRHIKYYDTIIEQRSQNHWPIFNSETSSLTIVEKDIFYHYLKCILS